MTTNVREPQSTAVLTLLVLVGVFLAVVGWITWIF